MRAILIILILAVVAVIAAVGTGLVNINQTRGAAAPDIDASRNGVSAQGGQAPAFDIETGSVAVGTTSANVTLPSLQVKQADDGNGQQQQQQANTAQPGNAAAQ